MVQGNKVTTCLPDDWRNDALSLQLMNQLKVSIVAAARDSGARNEEVAEYLCQLDGHYCE